MAAACTEESFTLIFIDHAADYVPLAFGVCMTILMVKEALTS